MKKGTLTGNFAEKVDIGQVRKTNEDRAFTAVNAYGDVILVVCDGMGGSNRGDLAASLTIETIDGFFSKVKRFGSAGKAKRFIRKCFRVANRTVFSESYTHEMYRNMGTCVSIAIITEDYLTIGHMGDTRVYWLTKNGIVEQLTTDHNLAQRAYRTGKITKEEIPTYKDRHVLTNVLGVHPIAASDVDSYDYHGETVFVCSDGLYNNVSEAELTSILKGKDKVSQKVNELIRMANANGGSDNIAAVLWESKK